MTFTLLCELRRTGKNTYTAVCYPRGMTLDNVLLANDDIIVDIECEHLFKLVVNKKGSLTLLCIK